MINDTLKASIAGILFTAILVLSINLHNLIMYKEPIKQEVMLCGTPRIGLHYVENYTIDKGYVIDFKSGGVWGVNFCRAYKGE